MEDPWGDPEVIKMYKECDQLNAEVKRLRETLERIKVKGDGTWSADRCAVEAEAILDH